MQRFMMPAHWLQQPIDVVLVGVGGTGSEMLDGLVRLHMALVKLDHPGLRVTVFDADEVSSANIGRQRFYPGDEGQNKSILSVHRINLFNGLDWRAVPRWFDPMERMSGWDRFDLLVTCVDKASTRADIGKAVAEHASYRHGLWLDTGNNHNTGQCILGTLGRTAPKLPSVFDLYPELETMVDDNEPSCSFEQAIQAQDLLINRVVADAATDLLWQLIRHGQITHHGAFVEVSPMRVTPLRIDPTVWASLGWREPAGREPQAPHSAAA